MPADASARPVIRSVTADRWDDLAGLFERPGPRGGRQDTANCWCVVWRDRFGTAEANRDRLCGLVRDGQEPGLLAYLDDDPVGWVSVAPLAQFEGLQRSTRYRPRPREGDRADAGTTGEPFVVSCFHVDRRARGQGIAGTLLAAAIDHAAQRGASVVHAYPADPPDYKGDPAWFRDAGFEPVREIGKRTEMRLEL
jgi:GNAT superfamily N-acetyltransferase